MSWFLFTAIQRFSFNELALKRPQQNFDLFFLFYIIIGIYITFVLALSRILRIMVINSSMRIMFEQLPNVDKILKLLNSIYMVRENKKFMLEEKLFSKLIFLYRSPQTMIKYTRNTKLNSLAYNKKKQ